MKRRTLSRRHRSRGITLVVSLLFMIIIAMLGVAIGNVSSLELRMAGNTRDHDLALQAAEAALRDAENRLNTNLAFRATVFPTVVPANANSAAYWETCFTTTPTPPAPCTTVYTPTNPLPSTGNGAVAAAPQFVVEQRTVAATTIYRVTARGVGATSAAVAILQAEYQ